MSHATVPEIIDQLGGIGPVATLLGKGYSTVSEMKRRGTIPVEYWPALIEQARTLSKPIDEKALVIAHTTPAPAAKAVA